MTDAICERLYQRFEQVMQGLSLQPQQQIVIALGGGADSQTVLDCVHRYRQQHPNYRYLAIHLDHAFHPDSGDWSNTIEAAARDYGIATVFEPLAVATQPRQSKEAAGRERRYQRLAELTDDDAVILLGQHRNDQIETFLLQLNRGSGPKGLSAMAEVHSWRQQRRLVRPLLSISKADILHYAQQKQLVWIEDDTNYDTRIERNFLRHQVIPTLEQRWPQLGDSVLRSSRLCAEQQQVLEQLLDDKLADQFRPHALAGTGLPVAVLQSHSEAMQRAILRRWLETVDQQGALPSYQQLEQIRQQAIGATQDSQMQVSCSDYSIRWFDSTLFCVANRQTEAVSLPPKIDQVGDYPLPEPWGQIRVTEGVLALGAIHLCKQLPKGKLWHPKRRGGKSALDWLKVYQVPSWLRRSIPTLVLADEWVYLPTIGWLMLQRSPSAPQPPDLGTTL